MARSRFLLSLILGALWGPLPLVGQTLLDRPIEVAAVSGAVHMITTTTGFRMNMAVSVGPDGMLLVDHQVSALADTLRATLATLGDVEVRYIINTHWHPDHTGGNAVYGPAATVLAHRRVRERVQAKQHPYWAPDGIDPLPPGAWPTLTFEAPLSLYFNGEAVEIIPLAPAHTDGDAAVYFTGSNVAILGDVFHGRGTFSASSLDTGGDIVHLADALGSLLERLPEDVQIITGHGGLATWADLQAYHDVLTATLAMVREKRAAGYSLEAVTQGGLPEPWKGWITWHLPATMWLENIYQDLARQTNR